MNEQCDHFPEKINNTSFFSQEFRIVRMHFLFLTPSELEIKQAVFAINPHKAQDMMAGF